MKNSIIALGSSVLLTITVLSSCQSSNNKNAQEGAQKAKSELVDSKMNFHEIRLDTINNFEQFNIEAKKLLVAQEKNIAELKAYIAKEKTGVKQDYEKEMVALENKNKELKKNLAEYKDAGQEKWNKFKKEFNRDMNELGKAFKDITVNNIE